MKSTRRPKPPAFKSRMPLRILKASLVGCVITVIMILLFALVLKWEWLEEGSIPIATSIMKAICAGFVGLLCANGVEKQAWLWAGIGGASYIMIAFFAFLLVEKAFSISLALLADVGMGFIAGIAGSILLQIKQPG